MTATADGNGMRYGIHLPQFGRSAVAGAIERAAKHAGAISATTTSG